jgi:hypothetical protein
MRATRRERAESKELDGVKERVCFAIMGKEETDAQKFHVGSPACGFILEGGSFIVETPGHAVASGMLWLLTKTRLEWLME